MIPKMRTHRKVRFEEDELKQERKNMLVICTNRRKANIGSHAFFDFWPQSLIKSTHIVQCKCETFCSRRANPFGHLLERESDNTSVLSDRLRRSTDCDTQSGNQRVLRCTDQNSQADSQSARCCCGSGRVVRLCHSRGDS